MSEIAFRLLRNPCQHGGQQKVCLVDNYVYDHLEKESAKAQKSSISLPLKFVVICNS